MQMKYKIFTIATIVLALLVLTAQRFKPSTGGTQDGGGAGLFAEVQGVTLKNSENMSSAATAQTVSIAGVTGQAVFLYGLAVRSSAAPVTPCSVTVKDGVAGTIIWSTDTAYVKATTTTQPFPTPLTSTLGNGMDIVVGTCGTAITSILDVQASQF
jgi:hypothetical protein